MTEILALTQSFVPYLSTTSLRQLRQIILAILCIPGRITMLGLSRWTEKGGSYRTLQRWFHSPIDWPTLLWTVIQVHLLDPNGEYLLGGDDVVVSKSGKETHGLGRFYSSITQKVIPALSFFVVSLIDVNARRSYPLQVEQRQPHSRPKSEPPAPKRPRGRPKGSKNYTKTPPPLTPELALMKQAIQDSLRRVSALNVKWIALDGAFGTFPAVSMVLSCGIHLISKFRHDAALYLAYTGPKPARGATRRHGEKLNYDNLPPEALCDVTVDDEGEICTETYQLKVFHENFQDALNVAIVVKIQLKTGKRAHVILFSTDLELSAAKIVDYYSLRYQIEFNFRDAKQYWGLEDFMAISRQAVTNAVNLAFLMVNLSAAMLRDSQRKKAGLSVLDLKADFRARRYLTETIKCLAISPDEPLISRLWHRLISLGGIRTQPPFPFRP